jgi:hypothetical protein
MRYLLFDQSESALEPLPSAVPSAVPPPVPCRLPCPPPCLGSAPPSAVPSTVPRAVRRASGVLCAWSSVNKMAAKGARLRAT